MTLTRSTRTRLLAGAVAALGLVLSACSGGDTPALDLSNAQLGSLTTSNSTGALEARIVNANDQAYANQNVLLTGISRQQQTSRSLTTNARGIIRAGNLPPGDYSVLAGSESFTAPVRAGSITHRRFDFGSPTEVRDELGFLYVINGLGETLSRIDVDTGEVANNVVATGRFPNAVRFHRSIGYIVNSGDNTVQTFDPETAQTLNTIALTTGSNPYEIVFAGEETAYVSLLLTNRIAEIDLASSPPRVVQEIPLGDVQKPEGMLVVGNSLYVACAGWVFADGAVTYGMGRVLEIDLATKEVERVIEIGQNTNPQALALGNDGMIYVVATGNYTDVGTTVYRINPASGGLSGAPLPLESPDATLVSAGSIAVTPNGYAFLNDPSHNRLHVIDTNTGTLLNTGGRAVPTGTNPLGVAASDNNRVWVMNFNDDTVSGFNALNLAPVLDALAVGDGPQAGSVRSREAL